MVLDPWAASSLRIAGIAVGALVAFLLMRGALRVGVGHVLERRAPPAEAEGPMSAAELQRRVMTLERLALRIVSALLAVIALLMVLAQLGIDIGPAVAGLGVVGIALGFGAQALVRDWLAGVFIVIENQYSAGDVVRIAGVEGVVEDLSLRRTAVRDLDGALHVVPNGQIVVASNLTRGWARVNVDVSVPYGADLERATTVINDVGRQLMDDPAWSERLLEAPVVDRVEALGDAAVILKVLGRVRPAEQWAVAGELRRRVLAAFAAEADAGLLPRAVSVS